MKYAGAFLITALLVARGGGAAQAQSEDARIREIMIEQSITAYSGPCPCPYNVMRNGRRCGGFSAWSKPGGASPLCYPDDISAEMVAEFRRRHGL
ncbi:hypothetical protein [Afifella sp. IM 167]|uniref:hypothetical protein n=1 Tax=Afifella sp. IM 167 TaxID=2033586 RepID=UPI001CCD05F9|nr:hypothetical protein [Afifella sp. IM 167]MBZ8131675.1 hypothetical protein [Afifella sp. IM 167]